jgi:hypothetical protein
MTETDATEQGVRELVDQAAILAEEISQKTEDLRALKDRLAQLADYKEGSMTGRVFGGHYTATVTRKETMTWDQGKLDALRKTIGNREFLRVFKYEFKPIAKKEADAAIKHASYGHILAEALTVKEGSPQVAFKRMEDC